MKCSECCYSWIDEGNKAATCHFESHWYDDKAPCDEEEPVEDYDYCYDE